MQAKDFENILENDIPSLLTSIKNLESSLSPVLAKLKANRESVDPELMKKFDESLQEIEQAKIKLKEHGHFNSK